MKLYLQRRDRAKERLKVQLESGTKPVKNEAGEIVQIPLTKEDIARIKRDIAVLDQPPKKKKAQKQGTTENQPEEKDKWFIDIYSISMSYVKNSERRKNKGKSKKKMKRVKNVSFVKSVVARPGLVQQYKDGKMGLSPKSHAFKMRKEEITLN